MNGRQGRLARGGQQDQNAGMRPWTVLALLCWLPAAPLAGEITVYRCVDGKGQVTLQDEPCPAGQQQSARNLQRPVDAPPQPLPEPTPEPEPAPAPLALPRPAPPPLYVCTSYDGIVRESESYDPNPRCEPIVLYHPRADRLPPEWQTACRWVEDSCVRLTAAESCERYRRKLREAQSLLRQAFSDTQAYRRSEVARLSRIVDDSCR